MGKAKKILEKWKSNPPKDAPYKDIETIVSEYLGEENIRIGFGSSHTIIIDGPIMSTAQRMNAQGISELSGFKENTMSIPRHHGKKVKQIYIKKVVALIKIKEQLDNFENKKKN